jgi:signal transduction histidine kinase
MALKPLAVALAPPVPVTVVAIFVLARLFEPLTRAICIALDRYLYRAPFDSQRTLREASGVIASMLDLQPLLDYVCELIVRTVRPEAVAVYLSDQEPENYRLVILNRMFYGGREFPSVVARSSPLPTALEEQLAPLPLENRRANGDGPVQAALKQVASFGGHYVHPIRVERRLIGFLVLGRKRSGDPYFQEDIDLLATIASQAAIAVRNAQLYRKIQEVEAERRRTERLAELGSLASGIAHEIKNPLVAIRTFAELLPDRFTDEEFRADFSRVMIREIQRIDELVQRLRGLAGPSEPKFQPLDLRDPIEEILTLLQGRLEQARIVIVRDYQTRLSPVLGDANQLKQFFLNVFINALDAMPNGGTLAVRLSQRLMSARETVVAEVQDSGCGIPEPLLSKIFEPFFTTKPQGSGLGLSICRGIADAHRATIRAHNNPAGPGASVIIEFPIEANAIVSYVSRES